MKIEKKKFFAPCFQFAALFLVLYDLSVSEVKKLSLFSPFTVLLYTRRRRRRQQQQRLCIERTRHGIETRHAV